MCVGDRMSFQWMNDILIGSQFTKYFARIFKGKVIKRLSRRVSAEEHKGHHSVWEGYAYKPMSFSILLRNKSPIQFSVKSIHYRVDYDHAPLQVVYWNRDDKFASNGLDLEPQIQDLPPYGDVSITLLFNPLLCLHSLPQSNKGWNLHGSMELDSFYGSLRIPFTISIAEVSTTNWEKVRKDYESFIDKMFPKSI